jgi:glucose-1-phosphate thymidylyltransferase
VQFCYAEQPAPRGLAEAFLIGREFIAQEPVCLILGDNIFFGHGLPGKLQAAAQLKEGALVYAYPVRDPERYGVIKFDEAGQALSIEEKPLQPKSNYAVPGIYFYDKTVVEKAASLRPSKRGELEITDLNQLYLQENKLQVEHMGRGTAWLDAGTHESLMQAASFVQAVEERQGMMISCPEEIAYRYGFITRERLISLARELGDNSYTQYLLSLGRSLT